MDEIGILTVCTGNVCRSPLMERLLQRTLDRRYGAGAVPVASAGTMALVGSPMDERAADVLRGMGGDPDGFAARRLVEPMVASAALVLTATREHRSLVCRMHPRAMRRTFTFRELAHVLEQVGAGPEPASGHEPAELLARLAEIGSTYRGLHRPARQEDLDVADPYRRGDEVYALMRDQVAAAYPTLDRLLGGA